MNEEKYLNEIFRKHKKQLYIQLSPSENESIAGFCERLKNKIKGQSCQIIKAVCFGSLKYQSEFETEIRKSISGSFPLTWVEGTNCSNAFMNGLQLWATESEISYLTTDFNAYASFFEDENSRYLYIGHIHSDPSQLPKEAYSVILGKLNIFLENHDFSFKDVVRTWYYLDDILGWYDEFNEVRTDFFKNTGVLTNRIPASTGVGGKNEAGSSVTMELLATQPKNTQVTIESIAPTIQNEAMEYGSSFSRAIKISSYKNEWMTISGTASVLPNGKTTNVNDLMKQIHFSFQAIEGLLLKETYSFKDIVRATAYLKDKNTMHVLQSFISENPNYQFPFVISENTICRDNLLFEIELDLEKGS